MLKLWHIISSMNDGAVFIYYDRLYKLLSIFNDTNKI